MIPSPTEDRAPLGIAFEHGIIFGLVGFISGLIATKSQFPPTPELLYATGLPALLAGAIAYAHQRRIPVQGTNPP